MTNENDEIIHAAKELIAAYDRDGGDLAAYVDRLEAATKRDMPNDNVEKQADANRITMISDLGRIVDASLPTTSLAAKLALSNLLLMAKNTSA